MKVLTIVGARPQFIKAATVSREIALSKSIKEVLVHTGQHYDENMSKVFFDQLDIPKPDYNLSVGNLSHGAMTGQMMEKLEVVMETEAPNCVLVYGDTNSTLAGAITASKLKIPISHVEAGLRSHNLQMPEEANRVLTDRLSSLLFCPTLTAKNNLMKEGYPFREVRGYDQVISNVGDVMFDAVNYYKKKALEKINLNTWNLKSNEYVLCTLHRAENTDNISKLKSVFSAFLEISKSTEVVFVCHPRTASRIEKLSEPGLKKSIKFIDPQPYLEMQRLIMGSKLVMTDSGGMQKEAYFHGVPCLTLRQETEWEETLKFGWNKIVGTEEGSIISSVLDVEQPTRETLPLFGDGCAAKKIIKALEILN